MISIDGRFETVFSELEEGHIRLKERLNGFPENGKLLEERLLNELPAFESWRFPLMEELGRITEKFDSSQKEVHQEFVRKSPYFHIVQEAPFYWRIINKPNGYAGDAYMMSFIYQNRFEGNSPFGKFLHKHALSTKACQSVRNRKDYLAGEINQLGTGKILSLAAGPAQEIREVLTTSNGNYRFLALDHDMDALGAFQMTLQSPYFTYALANAFQIISGNYMTARPRKSMVRYCFPRKDFKGLRRFISSFKYELEYLHKGEYDLIYSAGLYDYIKTFLLDDTKGTIALTKNLFELLSPGGTLIVGNFNLNNPRDLRFMMEYVYDWQLIYRGKQEMHDFIRGIPENQIKSVQLVEEPLGINYFLRIEKN
jgi:extracellular factor (EF) 3-hydroxypalmitic acid methyl ester biosynthesis protein